MIVRLRRLMLAIEIMAVVAFGGGCTFKITVPQGDLLKPGHGSPLQRVPRLSFVLNAFKDNRVLAKIAHSTLHAKVDAPEYWIGQYGATYTLLLDTPVGDVVTQAIANELERNGHRVLKADRLVDADVVIKGTVVAFYIFRRETGVDVKAEVQMSASAADGDILWARPCGASDSLEGVLIHYSEAVQLLGRALTSTVEDCTASPEFLNALERVKRKQAAL